TSGGFLSEREHPAQQPGPGPAGRGPHVGIGRVRSCPPALSGHNVGRVLAYVLLNSLAGRCKETRSRGGESVSMLAAIHARKSPTPRLLGVSAGVRRKQLIETERIHVDYRRYSRAGCVKRSAALRTAQQLCRIIRTVQGVLR